MEIKERIKEQKLQEAKEEKFVKDNGIKLERDKCKECIEIKAKDERNALGKLCYCSASHAYELGDKRKALHRENRIKELFDMVYQWGSLGVRTDHKSTAFREIVDELIDTYY